MTSALVGGEKGSGEIALPATKDPRAAMAIRSSAGMSLRNILDNSSRESKGRASKASEGKAIPGRKSSQYKRIGSIAARMGCAPFDRLGRLRYIR